MNECMCFNLLRQNAEARTRMTRTTSSVSRLTAYVHGCSRLRRVEVQSPPKLSRGLGIV